MYESKVKYFYGTGRRKHSVARVRIYPGSGNVTINGRGIDDYFGLETLKLIVRQPLALTDNIEKFDIVCTVAGGGVTGQAGAIRHGVSRALLEFDPELRPALKKAGFLTPDPRMKERRSTVSRLHVVLHSSQRDNFIPTGKIQRISSTFAIAEVLFFLCKIVGVYLFHTLILRSAHLYKRQQIFI